MIILYLYIIYRMKYSIIFMIMDFIMVFKFFKYCFSTKCSLWMNIRFRIPSAVKECALFSSIHFYAYVRVQAIILYSYQFYTALKKIHNRACLINSKHCELHWGRKTRVNRLTC